ncbi:MULTISPECIES: DUF6783 domain-containing protein [Blautia]|uniref:DUF6783 domain-containing protein n=1 Tax=Blautia caccae TaxID=3133175 RepID=A0ABV1DKR7_9FIRM|nr:MULTISPECIES: DUF6783 domain-containing protein [Blautia]MDY4057972.1 DUF6783 domain-containing protein [Blautia sp.]
MHSDNLYAPLCGIFAPYSVSVARYAKCLYVSRRINFQSARRLQIYL